MLHQGICLILSERLEILYVLSINTCLLLLSGIMCIKISPEFHESSNVREETISNSLCIIDQHLSGFTEWEESYVPRSHKSSMKEAVQQRRQKLIVVMSVIIFQGTHE